MHLTDEECRKELVDLVKASGQEVIDRAEEIVGEGRLLTGFEIRLAFSIGDNCRIDRCPEIEVNKVYVSKNAVQTLIERER